MMGLKNEVAGDLSRRAMNNANNFTKGPAAPTTETNGAAASGGRSELRESSGNGARDSPSTGGAPSPHPSVNGGEGNNSSSISGIATGTGGRNSGGARRRIFTVSGSLIFRADFDGGNLGGARLHTSPRSPSDAPLYELSVAPDCQGTKYEAPYKLWYHFCVQGGQPGKTIRMRIVDLHPICKVYNRDMRPLVRIVQHSPTWERLEQPCDTLFDSTGALQLTFTYTFLSTLDVHFAFYYPFAYSDCQRLLKNIDGALGVRPTVQSVSSPDSPLIGGSTAPVEPDKSVGIDTPLGQESEGSYGSGKKTTAGGIPVPPHQVYYHRELLTWSPEGRRVELLTISSFDGIQSVREPKVEGLFPTEEPRPFRFYGKPGIFIGARVHPGETAASYMLHGLLAFLLQPKNPYAKALRKRFVVKVVPMINPDGVSLGHFRLDKYGVNLNRAYGDPTASKQPSIKAIKEILHQMKTLLDPASRCFPQYAPADLSCGGISGKDMQRDSGLFFCLDLHGFTARQGCYLLGNALSSAKTAESLAFANVMQLYSPQFNASACSFGRGKKNGFNLKYDDSALKEASSLPPVNANSQENSQHRITDLALIPLPSEVHKLGAIPPYSSSAESNVIVPDPGWPARIAGLVDPYVVETPIVHNTKRRMSCLGRLRDGDAAKINKDWASLKSRTTNRTEGNKDGAGRVCIYREYNVPHCYTIECSCNLLQHAQVFSRLYAAPHAHREYLKELRSVASGRTESTKSDSMRIPNRFDRFTRNRLNQSEDALSTASDMPEQFQRPCTLVQCQNAHSKLHSQRYSQMGTGQCGNFLFSKKADEKESPRSDTKASPRGKNIRCRLQNPYMCQVDSLQPPRRSKAFLPPFGFPDMPTNSRDKMFHYSSDYSKYVTSTFHCPWGTCPFDPPAVFAGVGRAVVFAIVELSGGPESGHSSRLHNSVWRDLSNLRSWAQRCTTAMDSGTDEIPPASFGQRKTYASLFGDSRDENGKSSDRLPNLEDTEDASSDTTQ
eukprot:gb/GECG01004114.1/.p1 GENE.gb/GECG01004114.1/~~gb/GECG01004114.1/.p1  ORF type:complete len:1007 (+),score=96.04 gb/GECG01004114.1/:1-3021(+)